MEESTCKGQDRRKFRRIPFWYPFRYRVFKGDWLNTGPYEHGFSRDISLGGIKFRTDKAFKISEKIDMKLFIPSVDKGGRSGYIFLVGNVVRVEKIDVTQFDIAVKFGEIAFGDQKMLGSFLDLFGKTQDFLILRSQNPKIGKSVIPS